VTEVERKHLVETDRQIAECKEYIAKQRELIERAIQLEHVPPQLNQGDSRGAEDGRGYRH
jgi:hypothetical protein